MMHDWLFIKKWLKLILENLYSVSCRPFVLGKRGGGLVHKLKECRMGVGRTKFKKGQQNFRKDVPIVIIEILHSLFCQGCPPALPSQNQQFKIILKNENVNRKTELKFIFNGGGGLPDEKSLVSFSLGVLIISNYLRWINFDFF